MTSSLEKSLPGLLRYQSYNSARAISTVFCPPNASSGHAFRGRSVR